MRQKAAVPYARRYINGARGNISMYCLKCNNEFNYEFDPTRGTHAEYKCSCGQLLQWDHPVSAQSGKIMFGPPKPCEHEKLKKSDALIPIF